MFCTKCGKPVDEIDTFCRSCGHGLKKDGLQSPPAKVQSLDPLLGVRIVLLLGAGICAFTVAWPLAAVLAFLWIISMVWPVKK